MTQTPDDFATYLIDHLSRSTDTSTVDLIPAQCGAGKSTFVTKLIADTLRAGKGLLVVTDEIDRLNSYRDGANPLGDYIRRNHDRIFIITAENAKTEREKLYTKSIVLMTTQRYFALSPQDIRDIAEAYIPKRNIIIDERAPLTEQIKIDIGVLNTIDTILYSAIDDTAHYKQDVIDLYASLKSRLTQKLDENERNNNGKKLCTRYTPSANHATSNDERFRQCVFKTYRDKIRSYKNEDIPANFDVLKKIETVLTIATKGALIVSEKKQKSTSKDPYANYYIVTLDHRELVTDVGAKVVILDGTGDIDPVYDVDYINRINADQFQRRLDRLTINIVDINTSKNEMTNRDKLKDMAKVIAREVDLLPKRAQAVFVNKHDALESMYSGMGYHTGHFRAIRGSNAYRDMTDLAQVGLYRIPDEFYLEMATQRLNSEKQNTEALASMTEEIMCKSILTDTEQNIFRGCIRNADDSRRETYTLFYRATATKGKNQNELALLTEMIQERYSRMGATVNVIETPATIMDYKSLHRKGKGGERNTKTTKLRQYFRDMRPGEEVTTDQLCRFCQTNANTLGSLMRGNDELRQIMQSWHIRKGVYRRPESA